ncbi:MAG: 3-deoxy-D-manno-octulosonic acid transferase [Chlorobiaceae bacterium]|nr:3-deoxy-D-manno-octulosonic acid transferase [Chlorobiaceae bacterium]
MNSFTLHFYSDLIPLIFGIAKMAAPFNPKIRNFFKAREGLFEDLEKKISSADLPDFKLWVHASSVGEFEQARPVISALKQKYPDIVVFVSFLSDSGFNACRNYADAAAIFYLPADTRSNARHLLSMIKPDVLLLMRYDFWPNHLLESKKQGTKLILAAAVLPNNSQYFSPFLKSFYRNIFALFDRIYTVSENDAVSFRQYFNCLQAEAAGDPRFDQVVLRSRNTGKIGRLKELFGNRMAIVAGSVWEKDEEALIIAWKKMSDQPSLILVPHEVDQHNMQRLYRSLEEHSLPFMPFSNLDNSFDPERHILVIDRIGFLAELYSIASIAYVGGGFIDNVHNTLEPAVYGIPVISGPNIQNSPEAEELVRTGGAFIIDNAEQLYTILTSLVLDPSRRMNAGRLAGKFVEERTGGTAKIVAGIESLMPAIPV